MDYEKNKTLAILKQMVADGKITQADAEKYCQEIVENEDEMMIKFIKEQLLNIKKTITENYELDAKLTKAIDWLEKQGEQKPAWSEEDEDMLYKVTAILNRLCAKGEEFIWSPKTLEKLFFWLQNLKPQSHWKPSDRELGAILVAIGDEKQKGSNVAKELRNIYQQLKELKG